MSQVSRRPTSAHSREPFHPYKKVAEDALSRAIVRKQAAQFTRYRRNRKQASRPRLPSCDEPKAGNDVSASAEDSTYVQQSTHEEVAADAIVSDGVSGSNTTPERTDVTKGLLPWPAGFFGGVWKRLIGDAPVSGVYVPINSAAAHAERHTQHDEILARKRGREDDDNDEGEDEDVHTTVTGAKGDQEQGVTSKEHREKHRARKRRRDTEPEESTCTSEVSCADDPQQDMHVGEETGQAGDAREPETLALDPGNQSSHDAANPEQERIVEEAVCPEAECSSGADEFAGDAPDPEQGGDGEEAAREEDGYCSVADGSMYDTEDSGEGHNREEESGDEFEGFFHIGSSEERELDDEMADSGRSDSEDCEVGERSVSEKNERESEQSEASDTKGKKRAVDVNPLAFPRPLDTGVFSRVPLDPESAAKKANTSGHGWTSQPPTRSAKTFASVELQELQETLESKIRQNIRQELGQIVEAAVANAIAKALPNGLIRSSVPDSAATSGNSMPLARGRQKKVKQLPRPRPSEHNAFKKSVRELGQKLLGLESSKDLPRSVGQEKIAAWDPRHGPCCTVDDFSVDLQGYARSEWNRSAAQVFAVEYLKRYEGDNYTLEFVAEAWLTRVAGMKAQFKNSQQDKAIRKDRKALHRRRQRKQELYARRLDTAYRYAEIKDQAVPVVQSLGLDGMSSDESDHEGHDGEATYYILDKDWRSRRITAWLRMLDALHLRLRYSGEWQATSGAWPHFRTSSLRESARPAVGELPTDFYSHNWYQAQSSFVKGQLKATKPRVSLEIPAEYLKLSEQYNISDRKVVRGQMS